jgi:hypothetical protein
MGIMIYTIIFIETMAGGTQTFLNQVVDASIVNQSIIYSLLLGIIIMIIERSIYKRNPKEWRKYFQYKEDKKNHPTTEEQLEFCLKQSLKQKKSLEQMRFQNLEYNEDDYVAEIENNKKGGKKVSITSKNSKKKRDHSHKVNPLLSRYYFLIIMAISVTLISWAFLPITYSVTRISSQLFAFEFSNRPGEPIAIESKASLQNAQGNSQSSSTPVYFQTFPLVQIFYALFLFYFVLSAFQIRLGEPINKGRRELLSKYNMMYMLVNKIIRVIPFFFTISITIDFMLTATSLDIWEWFKFESIYEQLYNDILDSKGKTQTIAGLKLGRVSKLGLGSVLTFTQIFLLICPFIFYGKFTSEKNFVIQSTLDVALSTGTSHSTLYSANSAKAMNSIGNLE